MTRFLRKVVCFATVFSGGCGGDPNCSAFDFAPAPATLTLEDADGERICDLDEECEGDADDCLSIEHVEYPNGTSVPAPEDREEPFNAALSVAQYEEFCEFRVASWLDRELQEPVRVRIRFTGSEPPDDLETPLNFESDKVSFNVEPDECGAPSARAQIVEVTTERVTFPRE